VAQANRYVAQIGHIALAAVAEMEGGRVEMERARLNIAQNAVGMMMHMVEKKERLSSQQRKMVTDVLPNLTR